MASTSRSVALRRAGLLGTQVALGALLCSTPAWPASTAVLEAERPAAGPLGAIAGQVTDDATGDPLPDVFVVIHDQNGSVDAERTDAGGNYVVDGLPAGTYFAVTSNGSHLDELYDGLDCEFFCNPTTGTPIPVTSGGTTSGIDFALPAGGEVTGTVTDAGGNPIPDVQVFLTGVPGSEGSAHTDIDGVYAYRGLQTGTYFLRTISALPYVNEMYDDIPCPFFFSCDPKAGTAIAVTQGTTTAGIDLVLDLGGAITGTIASEETGLPLLGVQVRLYDELGFAVSGGSSSADGVHSAVGLPAGTYYARTVRESLHANERFDELPCLFYCPLFESTPITVVLGATTAGVDFTLTRRPLFWDGLESGGLGFWTGVAGGVTCAHTPCGVSFVPLDPGCDPCVERICAFDPYCCEIRWDQLCVLRVESVCSLECPGGPVIPDRGAPGPAAPAPR
jgi:hypothetical protein